MYESDLSEIQIDEVHTLDAQFKERLKKYLLSKNKPFTVQGSLDDAKERGVVLYPVSFKEILSNLSLYFDFISKATLCFRESRSSFRQCSFLQRIHTKIPFQSSL